MSLSLSPAHTLPGALPFTCWTVHADHTELSHTGVIAETLVSIYLNGQELATVMCSPLDEEALALGFLFNEGVISSFDEVGLVQANLPRTTIDVLLKRAHVNPPRRLILTSGCGGGVTLQHLTASYPALDSAYQTTPQVIFQRMKDLQGAAVLYQHVRGVHTAVLGDDSRLLVSAEDIGRHNAVDKVAGKALQQGIPTRDRLLLTSGRISSEMLAKARRLGVPIVASRTSPTSISLQLAHAWNICVVGYVRQGTLRVYTHPQRLGLPPVAPQEG
ncbi:MAG: formate dehydrogenase accessory sulfurtransferase FdhD [Chloroflexi bacterium]|nr:formate dehydrogenase accessory sulfurtransferase FdhD [Chloroflexota bacterium]